MAIKSVICPFAQLPAGQEDARNCMRPAYRFQGAD